MEVSIRMPLFSQLEGVRCTLFNLYCSSGDMVTSRKSNRSCYNLHEWPSSFDCLGPIPCTKRRELLKTEYLRDAQDRRLLLGVQRTGQDVRWSKMAKE